MTVADVIEFHPTRSAALERLAAFAPRAGTDYSQGRNYDRGEWADQSVSGLSPYLTRRMVTEQEVVEQVRKHHTLAGAEKYLQEVSWRTYWKGWLEQRPAVWTQYQEQVAQRRRDCQENEILGRRLEVALQGHTRISAFNQWLEEMRRTGYLHNHTRMWFAGVWIFDLGLPWELGAALFYENLLDRDAASNTLSWRWVAGLQTPGKRYLPRADNILTYSDGRFDESDTLSLAFPGPEFEGFPPRERLTFPDEDLPPPRVLLLTRDDLALDLPEAWTGALERVMLLDVPMTAGGFDVSGRVQAFDRAALLDASDRWGSLAPTEILPLSSLSALAGDFPWDRTAMPWLTVGPVRDALEPVWQQLGRRPATLLRPWDKTFWPHARAGYFGFWKQARNQLESVG